MALSVKILTLYPNIFPGPLGHSLSGKALEKGLWTLQVHQIRDYALSRSRSADGTPSGGGAGMVLRADVLARAIDKSMSTDRRSPLILMSPRGTPFTQRKAHELSRVSKVTIICGHFEGVDQRVIDSRSLEEISVGDYILSGGEVAAITVLDAIIRLIPGVVGNMQSTKTESFEDDLLEYPQYTRPVEFEGEKIPKVLTSGNHKEILAWRYRQSENLTRKRRPDLWKFYLQKERS